MRVCAVCVGGERPSDTKLGVEGTTALNNTGRPGSMRPLSPDPQNLTREQLDDEGVSPMSRSFAKFPPVYISVGQCEVLLDQVNATCMSA